MREFSINHNDSGQRLDKYLAKALPGLPPSLRSKYIRIKRIKINGKRCEANYRLEEGDKLQLYINDEFFDAPDPQQAWRRITPDIHIIYEDAHILLCDKVPGMVVHEDETGTDNTLINHIKAHLYRTGAWDPRQEASFTPALCNRIDRNTGGIVIAAKTAAALRILNEKIRGREISKYYLCLVHGVPPRKEGRLTGYITRDTEKKQVTVSPKPVPGALTAQMNYRLLGSRMDISLLECQLLTGRTHQIRAQMAALGLPLVGDTKYGTAQRNRGLPFSHQALYAYRLAFSFTSPAGELEYLKDREFRVKDVPFVRYFDSLPRLR